MNFVCVCVCVCVCVFKQQPTRDFLSCVYLYMCLYLCVCVSECVHVHVCVCLSLCVYVTAGPSLGRLLYLISLLTGYSRHFSLSLIASRPVLEQRLRGPVDWEGAADLLRCPLRTIQNPGQKRHHLP